MKRRSASDRMAECIIEMVHEYKKLIEGLNVRIEMLEDNINYWKNKTHTAVEQCNNATDTIGEIADIIAGITEHDEEGFTKIYLSDVIPDNESKLRRLFKLLDIPMTAEQIKDGDTDED